MISFCKIFYVSFIELLIPFYFLYRYFVGSDRASSKGYIVRWVEAPSNKLLTTAFEASLESVAVTLQAKRRQQDNRDSY